MIIRLARHPRLESLGEVEQVEGRRQARVGAAGNEDPHARRRSNRDSFWKGTHIGKMCRGIGWIVMGRREEVAQEGDDVSKRC